MKSVVFYRTPNNRIKLQIVLNCCYYSIETEKKLLITAPSEEAARYLDALLWQHSPSSFIPHTVSNVATDDWIVITTQSQNNLNKAPLMINLLPEVPLLFEQVEEIYELLEEHDEKKQESAIKKHQFYKSRGWDVHTISP